MSAMKTTEDLKAGGYKTVIEIFVPDEVMSSKEAAIGFAFKTCDSDYRNVDEITDNAIKFNGDPWWYFSGRIPTDGNSRFVLE